MFRFEMAAREVFKKCSCPINVFVNDLSRVFIESDKSLVLFRPDCSSDHPSLSGSIFRIDNLPDSRYTLVLASSFLSLTDNISKTRIVVEVSSTFVTIFKTPSNLQLIFLINPLPRLFLPSEIALALYSFGNNKWLNQQHSSCTHCVELWIRQIMLHLTRFSSYNDYFSEKIAVLFSDLIAFGGNIDTSRQRFKMIFPNRELLPPAETKNIEDGVYRDIPSIYSELFHGTERKRLMLALLQIQKPKRGWNPEPAYILRRQKLENGVSI